jgi:hypothetical protein
MRGRKKTQTGCVIGLYLMMRIGANARVLEPQHCGYLVPDSALSVEEEGYHHLLLLLRYGRSKAEVDLFMQSLFDAFPLLVHQHTLYWAGEHDPLYRLKQRFMRLGAVNAWCIREALSEFRTLHTCVAYLRAQVRLSSWFCLV